MTHLLTDALRGFGLLFRDAGRVLAAHWPQLLGLFLAGWSWRMAVLWLVVEISDWSPTVAVLLLPLAPMGTLLSFVLMLRAMAPTLPAFRDLVEPLSPRQRWMDDLTVAAQVLIPFLAVYASAGLLRQDVRVFLYDSTLDEWTNTNIQSIDWGRADYAPGWTIVLFVVGALAARKVITLMGLAQRRLAWAGVAVYLEVLWMMTLANALTTELDKITEWVTSRRLIAGLVDLWEQVVATVQGWEAWIQAPFNAVGALIGNLGSLVVVPVAWLAIGASVYGHKLAQKEFRIETHEEVTERIKRIPQPVRRAVNHVVEPVTSPIQSALGAIGKVASAGVLPMVLFCVVFVVANQIQVASAWGVRTVIGPGGAQRAYAMEPYIQLAEGAVYYVVVLALLAGAVNVIVTAQKRSEAAAAAQAAAAEEPSSA